MGTVILKLKPSNEPNLSDELRHWGIPGMKWGRRRFQNEDGTLTEAGKKRYAKQQAAAGDKAYKETINNVAKGGKLSPEEAHAKATASREIAEKNTSFDVGKEVDSDREAAKGILRETSNVANTAANVVRNRRVKVQRLDMSKMSDKELRDAVQRARLEEDYDRTFNVDRQKAEAGKERVANIMQTVSISAGVAISALTAAELIKRILPGG